MVDEKENFDAVATRLRAALGLSTDTALAERLGFKRTAWQARKARGALPIVEIEAVCLEHGINLDWVYSGKGEPRKGIRANLKPLQDASNAVAALSLPPHEARLLQELLHYTLAGDRDRAMILVDKLGLVVVPRCEVKASAGNGSINPVSDEQVVDVIAFRPDWLRQIGVAPGKLVVIEVRGDSMHETLQDGDLLLVDTSLFERRVNGIYVLVKGDALLVKRLNFKASGSIEIRSDNKSYPTETMSGAEFDQLHIVGRMVRRLVR